MWRHSIPAITYSFMGKPAPSIVVICTMQMDAEGLLETLVSQISRHNLADSK